MKRPSWNIIIALLVTVILVQPASGQSITSPEAHFGFQMGADRRLIDWKEITEYFMMLDSESDRVVVQELGKTTLGKPFLLTIISSAENIRNIGHYRSLHQKLANPHDLSDAEAGRLIDEGKIPVLLSLNIHSTEIGSSQESVELAFELATRNDEAVRHILDNVIVLMIPSVNPDGLQMVVDWYEKHVGTPHEGCSLPWLYHHYAGHDNNRDWFFFNLKESQLTSSILYHEWYPEIVFDQHQMGSGGPRLFLPPYDDPVNLNVHPVLMAEMNMLGKHVVADLHAQGFTGVVTDMRFNAFFQGVMARTPIWHNMLGILSEAASARLATPMFYPRGSLGKYGPERPRYNTVNSYLEPWEGGWWRLRDIIEYEKASTYSILDLAATYKEKFMTNFYNMNKEAIEKGETEPPFAFIFPLDQHDPSSAYELLKRLRYHNVKIYRSSSSFTYDGKPYPENTIIIPLDQSCRAAIKDLLEPQIYPNLEQYPDGPPKPPYDFTGWTLQLQMGVNIVQADAPLSVDLRPAEDLAFAEPIDIDLSAVTYLIERRYNNTYIILNELLKEGYDVHWLDETVSLKDEEYPPGTIIIPRQRGAYDRLKRLSETYKVSVYSLSESIGAKQTRVQLPRLAVYQPWTASMDEGWTRLVLDNFHFQYTPLHNEEVKKGKLRDSYDVILVADMSVANIVEGKRRWRGPPTLGTPAKPEKYRGGIGKEGVEALKDFVREGGTLITIGDACDLAIDKFRIPARDVLKDLDRKDYYAPGSLFQIRLNNEHPIGYGMPEYPAIRVTNSPAFQLLPYEREIHAVGYFEGENPLLSGWLIGPEKIAGQTVLAEIPWEEGRFILFGFGVQSRGQTYGTFKLLFNAILTSNMEEVN